MKVTAHTFTPQVFTSGRRYAILSPFGINLSTLIAARMQSIRFCNEADTRPFLLEWSRKGASLFTSALPHRTCAWECRPEYNSDEKTRSSHSALGDRLPAPPNLLRVAQPSVRWHCLARLNLVRWSDASELVNWQRVHLAMHDQRTPRGLVVQRRDLQ